jgi:hypothetical protein
MNLHPAIQPVEPSIRCRYSIVVLWSAWREDENPTGVRWAKGLSRIDRRAGERPADHLKLI